MSEYIRDEQARSAQREAARKDISRENQNRRPRNMARDDQMQRREEQESLRRLADVVNDPSISVDAALMRAINDPEMVMTNNGEIAKVQRRMGLGTGQFARQFSRGMGFDLPRSKQPKKRRGKKNPKLARAFKEANRRMRTKSGKLRKGRTQADIARLAHRLLKKM